MKTYAEMQYHPTSEKLVNVICAKVGNTDPLFFRVLVGYYFSMLASYMRCSIATHDQGDLPINMYAMNLAGSGQGKGKATGILDNTVIHTFRQRFLDETFPLLADNNLPKLAVKRAQRKAVDPNDELILVEKEFKTTGVLLFSFDFATPAALKQTRHKLLMANAGALNMQVDEIALNLSKNMEALTTLIELYDVGLIKANLIKNTADTVRSEEIIGRTPTNMMLFGSPLLLLNGGKTEEDLYAILGTGYARRCFFGYSNNTSKVIQTAEEEYIQTTNTNDVLYLEELADHLESLADIVNANKRLVISKDTTLVLIEYKQQCEAIARKLPEHMDMKKAEISHRYFKVLKLAGAYAFIDDVAEITTEHIYNAIKLAEDSGDAFNRILSRDRNYVKLAKYIAAMQRDITQADLVEDLPFYRGAASQKSEMLTLATAYGYKNNIIIKKSFSDGIEFLRGETLKETDLLKMPISYSTDITTGYVNEYAPFDQLHKLTQAQGMHWTSHHLNGGYRNEENALPGFSLVVLDVETSVNLSTAKLLLKDYKFMVYTTKRHTDMDNRFRIILPINYELALDAKDFKEFMSNIYEWLPFEVDTATNQRARKWLSHNGHYEYNDGELLDALPFIPKTSKNQERKELLNSQNSMDNLERWIINNIGDGNRNNMMLRYGLILVDAGFDFEGVRSRVITLNDKIPDKLDEIEIMGTVMITVGKAISKK